MNDDSFVLNDRRMLMGQQSEWLWRATIFKQRREDDVAGRENGDCHRWKQRDGKGHGDTVCG